jgi:hypothetical protein
VDRGGRAGRPGAGGREGLRSCRARPRSRPLRDRRPPRWPALAGGLDQAPGTAGTPRRAFLLARRPARALAGGRGRRQAPVPRAIGPAAGGRPTGAGRFGVAAMAWRPRGGVGRRPAAHRGGAGGGRPAGRVPAADAIRGLARRRSAGRRPGHGGTGPAGPVRGVRPGSGLPGRDRAAGGRASGLRRRPVRHCGGATDGRAPERGGARRQLRPAGGRGGHALGCPACRGPAGAGAVIAGAPARPAAIAPDQRRLSQLAGFPESRSA